MKQKIIGIYEAGYEQLELVLMEGTGGAFYRIPEAGKNKIPRIKVGADYEEFEDVLNVVSHEIHEYLLLVNNCRYNPSQDCGYDHAAYVFIMDHPTFSDIIRKGNEYICSCRNDLYNYWQEWKVQEKRDQEEQQAIKDNVNKGSEPPKEKTSNAFDTLKKTC